MIDNYYTSNQFALEMAQEKRARLEAEKELSHILYTCSMQGRWIGLWVIRRYCQDPAQVVAAYKKAVNLGVEVRGALNYDERKEYLALPGSDAFSRVGVR